MYCKKCGKELKEKSDFCSYCGTKIKNKIQDKEIKQISLKKALVIISVITILLIIIVAGILNMVINKSNSINDYESIGHETENINELKINNLEYSILVKENGNTQITEKWEVSIKEPVNLKKTITLDEKKFSEISDVKIYEISKNNEEKKLIELMGKDNLDKDSFYDFINEEGKFEIGWLADVTNEIKTYEIMYTVKDSVKMYLDCGEINLNILEENNEIAIDKLIVKLNVFNKNQNLTDVNYWIHPADNITPSFEENTAVFTNENITLGQLIDIRMTMPKKWFGNFTNIIRENRLEQIYEEEESDTANEDYYSTLQDYYANKINERDYKEISFEAINFKIPKSFKQEVINSKFMIYSDDKNYEPIKIYAVKSVYTQSLADVMKSSIGKTVVKLGEDSTYSLAEYNLEHKYGKKNIILNRTDNIAVKSNADNIEKATLFSYNYLEEWHYGIYVVNYSQDENMVNAENYIGYSVKLNTDYLESNKENIKPGQF